MKTSYSNLQILTICLTSSSVLMRQLFNILNTLRRSIKLDLFDVSSCIAHSYHWLHKAMRNGRQVTVKASG